MFFSDYLRKINTVTVHRLIDFKKKILRRIIIGPKIPKKVIEGDYRIITNGEIEYSFNELNTVNLYEPENKLDKKRAENIRLYYT